MSIKLKIFNFNTFDVESHDDLEKMDISWIIPNKFICFSGPTNNEIAVEIAEILSQLNIGMVIRLNNKM